MFKQTRIKRTRAALAVGAVAALSLGAAACGDDDDTGSDDGVEVPDIGGDGDGDRRACE